MKILSSAASHVGKVRRNNEDSFLVDEALGLYVVADGMGGHAGGETASRVAVESLHEAVRTRGSSGGPSAGDILQYGFEQANRNILETALRDPSLRGMGTTMTALLAGRKALHLAHLGDSRAYLLRKGVLSQLSEDHTMVGEEVRAGLLTPEQARSSVHRHILTKAVGIELRQQADADTIETEKDDVFLLCSDGLTEMVEDTELREILARTDIAEIPGELIESANGQGGVDNITVVALKISDPA